VTVRWLLAIALVAASTAVGSGAMVSASDAPKTRSATSLQSKVNGVERRVRIVRRRVRRMERSANRFDNWMTCIRWVRVSEFGDPDHRFGYRYDERDGTGLDRRPALAVDTRRGVVGDYKFLSFARRGDCHSDTTHPGTPEAPGTADPASLHTPRPVRPRATPTRTPLRRKVRRLERTLKRLNARKERLSTMSERFDQWESCLSWVPVTEYGDPLGGFGYLFRGADAALRYRAALAVDISEWDDPDYMFLAFAGRDRPFVDRECTNEPGESVD
jgi:hypothetical protein